MNRGEMESLDRSGKLADTEASTGDVRHSSLKPLLRLAALRGDSEHVLRYLQLGGDAEVRDQQGRTLHMLAASKGHLNLCRLIDEHMQKNEGIAGQHSEAAVANHDEFLSSKPNETVENGQSIAACADVPFDINAFKSEFFGEWLEEIEQGAPPEDPSLLSKIQEVHEAISRHVIFDKDEDWRDLAMLLPSRFDVSFIRELNHGTNHGLFSALIRRARTEGSFSPQDLEVISYEIDGVEAGDTYRQLTILMGQIESVSEEDEEWLPPLHFDEPNEPSSDNEMDELELFVQDLSSTTNDPCHQFLKIAQSSVLLDRTGEERIGLLLELSLIDAYRAIAESPHAARSIESLAMDLEQGRVTTGQISHMSSGEDDQISELHEASDDPNDEDCLDHKPAGKNLGEMLDSAHAACLAWQADTKTERLGKQAISTVSALELSSSTVRRFDQEFEAAGGVSLALRRAVERLSRLEHEIFHANIRLAVHVADSYAWSTLPRMDRIQESLIGLLKAIDRFDYRRGYKFSTYAMWWLKQSTGRAIGDKARVIRLPIHVMEKVNKVFKAVRECGGDTIESVHAQELASASELSLSDVAKILAVANDAVSWDQQDAVLELAFSTPDIALTPEEVTDNFLRERAVSECVNALPEREAEIIRHRFGLIDGNDKTLEEVGQIFGVTRERIRQIEAKALRMMRHPTRHLRELVDGKVETDDAAEQ